MRSKGELTTSTPSPTAVEPSNSIGTPKNSSRSTVSVELSAPVNSILDVLASAWLARLAGLEDRLTDDRIEELDMFLGSLADIEINEGDTEGRNPDQRGFEQAVSDDLHALIN